MVNIFPFSTKKKKEHRIFLFFPYYREHDYDPFCFCRSAFGVVKRICCAVKNKFVMCFLCFLCSLEKDDILTVLTRVNREVSKRDCLTYKQMPEPKYTLTKKLVLKCVWADRDQVQHCKCSKFVDSQPHWFTGCMTVVVCVCVFNPSVWYSWLDEFECQRLCS